MKFPKSLHAAGWQHQGMPRDGDHPSLSMADDVSPPQSRWGAHVLVILVAVGGLVASAGLAAVDERPLDVQMNVAIGQASDTLKAWHAELAHGLHVSMRAVADGHDTLVPSQSRAKAQTVAMAEPVAEAEATIATDEDDSASATTAAATTAMAAIDPQQPVQADLQPGAGLPGR